MTSTEFSRGYRATYGARTSSALARGASLVVGCTGVVSDDTDDTDDTDDSDADCPDADGRAQREVTWRAFEPNQRCWYHYEECRITEYWSGSGCFYTEQPRIVEHRGHCLYAWACLSEPAFMDPDFPEPFGVECPTLEELGNSGITEFEPACPE